MTENEDLLYSLYQIVKEKKLLGLDGAPLKSMKVIKAHIIRFPSYTKKSNPQGRPAHYVKIKDILDWNQKILEKLNKFHVEPK